MHGSATDVAELPGSGGVAHRTPVDLRSGRVRAAQVAAPLLAAVLLAAWLIVDPRTPDLAAQVYRAELFRQLGFAVWDEHWYAGHHLPGYSLLFGPVTWLLGVRLTGVVAVLASTLLFGRLVRRAYGEAAGWGAALFALAAVGDVWAGRVTFALGVALALAACVALQDGHPLWAAPVAALCAAASPVAGALLALAALTLAVYERSPRALVVLAAPAAIVVVALALVFPEGGWEPYPLTSFAATVLVVALFWLALPRGERLLRTGAALYLLACVACVAIHTPLGSNIERYAVLLAAPLLLCARLAAAEASEAAGTAAAVRGRLRDAALAPLALAALCAALVWTVWGPVRETLAVAGSPATSAAYYAPLERFLAGAARGPLRVEVPLTRSHWEAALLAPRFSLARGWEKQLDERYDRPLLAAGLDAASYLRWLRRAAVTYVALPDAALDPSSAREGRLIDGGLPFLVPVWSNAHWRVYRVLAPTPLLSGPGHLTALGHDSFALHADSAGRFVVRVRFTRYWTLARGHGCVRPAPGGWTGLTLTQPGDAVVAASFSLARVFATGGSCG